MIRGRYELFGEQHIQECRVELDARLGSRSLYIKEVLGIEKEQLQYFSSENAREGSTLADDDPISLELTSESDWQGKRVA